MDDFSQLLDQVAKLKSQRRSGFLGFDKTGEPQFARMEETIGVIGGSRSGKGAAFVIPSVALHPGPAIVTSIRNDVRDATLKAREAVAREYGGSVIELDFTPDTNNSTGNVQQWSILDGFNSYQECADLARSFVHTAFTNPEHDHWRDSVERLMIAYTYAARANNQTFLQMVRTIFRPLPGGTSTLLPDAKFESEHGKPTLQTYAATLRELSEVVIPDARRRGAPLILKNGLEMADEPWDYINSIFSVGNAGVNERGSIINFTSRLLMPWRGFKPLNVPAFNVSDFIDSHSTVFITLPEERASNLAPMVVAFLTCVIKGWNAKNAGRGFKTDTPLLLALDETANVSPIPQLTSLLSAGGGNAIQTLTVFQDPQQPRTRWGDQVSTIINTPNHKLLFGGVSDIDYLDAISQLSGTRYEEGIRVIAAPNSDVDLDYAAPMRLIREREELEMALSNPDATARSQDQINRLLQEMLRSRYQSGLVVRQRYILEANGDENLGLMHEIYGLTALETTRDLHQVVEVNELGAIHDGKAYYRSRTDGGFIDMPRWFESEKWMSLFGFAAEGLYGPEEAYRLDSHSGASASNGSGLHVFEPIESERPLGPVVEGP